MSTLTDTTEQERAATTGAVLEVEDLNVRFPTEDGVVHAVRGVSFSLRPGDVLGIVGESGSGKSVTSMAVMGLLPGSAQITGSVKFRGRELLGLNDRQMSVVRGKQVAMVFQDPMTSLDPVYKIGVQIAETVRQHDKSLSRNAPGRARSTCSSSSASPTRRPGSTPTRTSSPAACASASSSRSRWPTSPR
jgi:ABC-type microcin C transport system duplicated ATPase subunit YejF